MSKFKLPARVNILRRSFFLRKFLSRIIASQRAALPSRAFLEMFFLRFTAQETPRTRRANTQSVSQENVINAQRRVRAYVRGLQECGVGAARR